MLVSRAKDGAILLTEDGEIYKKHPQKGTVVNSVGAGDSMVAGFLAGYLNTGSYERALELGTAAGSATAFQSWLAPREDIVKLLEHLTANIRFERRRRRYDRNQGRDCILFAVSYSLCIIPPSIVGSAAGAVGSVVAMLGIVLLKKTLAAK